VTGTAHRAGRREPVVFATEPEGEVVRVLTIRFDDILEDVQGAPDLGGPALRGLLAGVDLLRGLINSASDFGGAAPGARAEESLAGAVLALTDEAFDAAHAILMETDWERNYGADPEDEEARQGRLLARVAEGCVNENLYEGITAALAAIPPAEDPSADCL
jgi:hypothetical protein